MSASRIARFVAVFQVLGVLCALHLACGTQADPEPSQPEITVRNLTRDAVSFALSPAQDLTQTTEVELAPGNVHRWGSEKDYHISFQRPDETITYRLRSGQSYTFRYGTYDELELFEGSHGRLDAVDLAPFVATPMNVVEAMLMLAKVDENDVVYDLGCGDGRIVITAAKLYGARGVGIELDPRLIEQSKKNALEEGVAHLVQFRMEDATTSDISEATVVTLYLLPESNELLRPRLEQQLQAGAYVVSHNYSIPGWEAKKVNLVIVETEDGESHDVYLYQR